MLPWAHRRPSRQSRRRTPALEPPRPTRQQHQLSARHAITGRVPSVEELARRAGVGRRALEALAAADAFAGLGLGRRAALWNARATEGRQPGQFDSAEPPLLREPEPRLPPEALGQAVVGDCRSTGLTLRGHPLALLRPALDALGCADTRRLASARQGAWIRLPGLVLMRQRPGTAKGVVFVTVEDELGSANLVVYADVGERDRAALIGVRLLVVEGRIEHEAERAEVPVTHVICRRLADRSDLLGSLAMGEASAALPASRDFR